MKSFTRIWYFAKYEEKGTISKSMDHRGVLRILKIFVKKIIFIKIKCIYIKYIYDVCNICTPRNEFLHVYIIKS